MRCPKWLKNLRKLRCLLQWKLSFQNQSSEWVKKSCRTRSLIYQKITKMAWKSFKKNLNSQAKNCRVKKFCKSLKKSRIPFWKSRFQKKLKIKPRQLWPHRRPDQMLKLLRKRLWSNLSSYRTQCFLIFLSQIKANCSLKNLVASWSHHLKITKSIYQMMILHLSKLLNKWIWTIQKKS